MHDLADEIRWIVEGPPSNESALQTTRIGTYVKLGISFLVGALLAGLIVPNLLPDSSTGPVARFTVNLPVPLTRDFKAFATAPDGSRFAYVVNDLIHVRELDELEARPLPGTGGGPRSLVFSPDGEWIAFYANGQLKKVVVRGGAPLRLSEVDLPLGITWGEDDLLRFGKPSGGIWQVPGDGGDPEPVLHNDAAVWRPQLLPDGRTYVFSMGFGDNVDNFRVAVQSPDDEEPRVIFEGADEVRYLPTGHLVFYVMSNELLAVPFDVSRQELVGSPVPVVGGSDWQYDVTRNGTLVYLAHEGEIRSRLLWVARDGVVSPAVDEPLAVSNPHLAPDGRRVAVLIRDTDGERDLWVYDLERETRTRITTGGVAWSPVWSPEGRRIVFASNNNQQDAVLTLDLFSKSADGSGEQELLLTTSDARRFPHSFSPDGQQLAFSERRRGSSDIWVLRLDGGATEPFSVTEFDERSPAFSPDGRFIAYVSNASGRDEVYVQPYPGPGTRTVISTEGGSGPVWSRDGKELFYLNGNQMMRVVVEAEGQGNEAAVRASTPEILFEGAFVSDGVGGSRTYDVSADGERFLMIEDAETRAELHVVLNWLEELQQRIPGAR